MMTAAINPTFLGVLLCAGRPVRFSTIVSPAFKRGPVAITNGCPSEFISRMSVSCFEAICMLPIFCMPTNTCATAAGHV